MRTRPVASNERRALTVYGLVSCPRFMPVLVAAGLCLAFLAGQGPVGGAEPSALPYVRRGSWVETLLTSRAAIQAAPDPGGDVAASLGRLWGQVETDFPVECDWLYQDCGTGAPKWFEAGSGTDLERTILSRVLGQLGGQGSALRQEFDELSRGPAPPDDPRWLQLYVQACEQRRVQRLQTVVAKAPRIVFTKHLTLRPSFFGYTEGQSDAQNERHFRPGSALCLLEIQGLYPTVRTLLNDPTGAIRDPAVSWDASRVLFAWKKSLDDDDYHLYEFELATGRIRQLTSGLGFADYEPAYLPSGDIVFTSTRCVQTVDCWWTEVSNLYTCDPDGRFLRRLTFDQVHALFPQVLDDGRVIYTRWDYNDRGQMFVQALFAMNPDGTGQTEFYGNNSWFPTSALHARGIPGTERVVCIFAGHHTAQAGKLGIVDPARGRQENSGAQLIAPLRDTRAERRDEYGQKSELFRYPVALTESEFLVSCAPLGWERDRARRKLSACFGIYWIDLDGHRELLVADAEVPCSQPVPLVPRHPPPLRPNLVDYRQTTGSFYLQDVYAGPGLAGVPRGAVKKLRVVALQFRAAGVGNNGSTGPSGEALVCTPVAIGNGSWDVKTVLGDATVHADGSAFFTVPARLPVYFQALDDKNRALQTMRSWSTLQPGESQSCTGCHEHKNTAPPLTRSGPSLAFQAGPQALEGFYGPPRGFSFAREIQPILDRHCVRCHNARDQKMPVDHMTPALIREPDPVWDTARSRPGAGSPDRLLTSAAARLLDGTTNRTAFSLLGETMLDKVAKRHWSDSYLNLTLSRPTDYYEAVGAQFGVFDGRVVNWIGSQSIPPLLPPAVAGACRSQLIALLENGHGGVKLSRPELDRIACWIDLFVPYCGEYTEANGWTEEETSKYQHFLEKRQRMESLEQRNIEEILSAQAANPPQATR
jgi:hypothetical protein